MREKKSRKEGRGKGHGGRGPPADPPLSTAPDPGLNPMTPDQNLSQNQEWDVSLTELSRNPTAKFSRAFGRGDTEAGVKVKVLIQVDGKWWMQTQGQLVREGALYSRLTPSSVSVPANVLKCLVLLPHMDPAEQLHSAVMHIPTHQRSYPFTDPS